MWETVPSCLRCCCLKLCRSVDDSYDKSPLLEPLNCLTSSRPPPSVQPLKHGAISLLMTCSRGLHQRSRADYNQEPSAASQLALEMVRTVASKRNQCLFNIYMLEMRPHIPHNRLEKCWIGCSQLFLTSVEAQAERGLQLWLFNCVFWV